ncbi:hypothetical protein [Nakamurella sp.]|uniref:hypothetical protein n=1 Tax=Nakamurella sp. TaxID=1869182 RepID=UPI0037838BB3
MPDAPDAPDASSGQRPPEHPPGGRAGPVVRVLDALTGLFAGGMVVLGAGLLLAQLLAPALLSAAGWGVATGPGWIRVLVHLLVGGIGEAVYRTRQRRTGPVRVVADVVVVVAAVAVIGWAWWP